VREVGRDSGRRRTDGAPDHLPQSGELGDRGTGRPGSEPSAVESSNRLRGTTGAPAWSWPV